MSSPHYETYKEDHKIFVSNETGTTVGEVLRILCTMALLPLLSSLVFPWVVPPKTFLKHLTQDSYLFTYIRCIIEYPFVLVLPLWLITVLAGGNDSDSTNWNDFMWIVVLSACLGIMVVNYSITEPKWEGITNFWERVKDKPLNFIRKGEEITKSQDKKSHKIKYPFLTNSRALIIYVTLIGILAVDFPIFPRRYAKTKNYGYSLMDLGTGSFVFANGIMAQEAKGRKSNVIKSLVSSIPLLILGFIRLISVKGIEYHEVVEEYGAHWNFFFTLAAVKVLSGLIFHFLDPAFSLKLACLVGIVYEYVLVQNDHINNYLLNPQTTRNDFISANREGLYSIWGYLVIYFSSVYVGQVLNYDVQRTVKDLTTYVNRSAFHITLLWIMHQISASFGTPSCRRAANLTYCLWAVASTYTVYWTYTAATLVQSIVQYLGLLHGPLISYELQAVMEKEEEKIKELNQQLKKNHPKQAPREAEIEEALSTMNKKLNALKRSEETKRSEMKSLIEQLENELHEIATQLELTDDEGEENLHSPSIRKNLVGLPDLTMSPVILEAVSYNGLFVFLLGNLLTGIVNCLVHTIYVPDYLALCYLWAYCTVLGVVSVTLYAYDIQLKFW